MENLIKSTSSKPAATDYFGHIKRVLRVLGVSLRDNDGVAYKIYTFLVFVPFLITYTVLHVLEILKSDPDDDGKLMMFFFPFCLGAVKGLYLLKHRMQIKQLLDKLEQDPFKPNRNRGGDLEEKLIEKYARITNLQAYIYWSFALLSATTDSLIVLSKRIRSSDYHDWDFAYGKFAVLNITYSPNYEICWLYQTVSLIPIAGHFMVADLIIAAFLANISCHFQILQNYIKQIARLSYEEMITETGYDSPTVADTEITSITPLKYLQRSIARVVSYHVNIINVAKEVEDLFKHLLLVIFLFALGTLCFLLYNVSKVPMNDPRALGATAAVITAYFEVLLLCYWGQQIIFESQEVGRAAFETNFVGADVRFQKSLVMIICRSQKPTYVTANNFSVVGLSTLLWIIRASYSSYTMLLHVNKN